MHRGGHRNEVLPGTLAFCSCPIVAAQAASRVSFSDHGFCQKKQNKRSWSGGATTLRGTRHFSA